MCNRSALEFCERVLTRDVVQGKALLEVGSLDVNGSIRGAVMALGPRQYVGVDMMAGPGVDQVCNGGDLIRTFGRDSFDVVVATEVLEHAHDWKAVVSNMKGVLRPGGLLVITTRSRGFPFHAYPFDYWRYERSDMNEIFGDMSIEALESDPLSPGIFMNARMPDVFHETDLNSITLYSIVAGKRTSAISGRDQLRYLLTHPKDVVIALLPEPVTAWIVRVLPESVKKRLR